MPVYPPEKNKIDVTQTVLWFTSGMNPLKFLLLKIWSVLLTFDRDWSMEL